MLGNSQMISSLSLSPSILWLSRTLCGIKHGSTPYSEKKENNRRVSLCFSSPLLLPETWKMETENRILIGCAPCTLILVNNLPAKRKILMETSFEIGLGDVPPPPCNLQQKINQKYVFDVR